ncbi:MAG: hypothetical protein EBZ61_09600, partial [Micrococcales bacterium]|nr:hypothetical protein [Micrococcales bacterium]
MEAEKAGDKALSDTYAKKAAEARDQVKDLQEKINALDPGAKAQAFAAFGQTVAGGLTAAISATALFGDKNKDLEATLVKVQSATALLQATQSIADGLKQASIIKTVAATVVGGTTGALKLFRIALAATGIGAVTVALGALIENFDKVKLAIQGFLDTLKDIPFIGKFIGTIENGAKKLVNWVTTSTEVEKKQKDVNTELKKTKENIDLVAGSTAAYNATIAAYNKELENTVIGSKRYFDILQKINEEEAKRDAALKAGRGDVEIGGIGTKTVTGVTAPEKSAPVLTAEAIANFVIASKKRQKDATEKLDAEEIANAQKAADAKFSIAQSGLNALASLGNIAIKNEAQREKFQKKIAATQILLDTAIAISQMVRDGSKVGVTPIEKAAAIASGIALVVSNIAKASALLSKAGTSTPPTLQGGGSAGAGVATPPTPTIPVFNPQGTIIPQGQEQGQQPIKAYVLEDDISTSQNRITDIKTKAL